MSARAVFLDRDGVINRVIKKNGKLLPPLGVTDFEFLPGVVDSLEAIAGLAAEQESNVEAARLFAAALSLRNAIGMSRWPAEQSDYDAVLSSIRAALGEAGFGTAWAEGERLSPDEAIAYACWVRGDPNSPLPEQPR